MAIAYPNNGWPKTSKNAVDGFLNTCLNARFVVSSMVGLRMFCSIGVKGLCIAVCNLDKLLGLTDLLLGNIRDDILSNLSCDVVACCCKFAIKDCLYSSGRVTYFL